MDWTHLAYQWQNGWCEHPFGQHNSSILDNRHPRWVVLEQLSGLPKHISAAWSGYAFMWITSAPDMPRRLLSCRPTFGRLHPSQSRLSNKLSRAHTHTLNEGSRGGWTVNFFQNYHPIFERFPKCRVTCESYCNMEFLCEPNLWGFSSIVVRTSCIFFID